MLQQHIYYLMILSIWLRPCRKEMLKGVLIALTERTIEHRKEPIAISRPDIMGQRIKYSHINNITGVMTACRKSEHGNIMDQSLKRNKVFREGQQLFSATKRMFVKGISHQQKTSHSIVRSTSLQKDKHILQLTWILDIFAELCSSPEQALASTNGGEVWDLPTHLHQWLDKQI